MFRWMPFALIGALTFAGCDDSDTEPDPSDTGTVNTDMGDLFDGGAPVDTGVEVDLGPRPAPGTRVDIDLAEWLTPVEGGAGNARVFVSQSADDLVPGQAATGKVGDWVLENDKVRLIVEADERVMGVCPYGGNIIDGAVPGGVDAAGEVCLFLGLSQTLKPDLFEIIADGSEGPVVLAVTGHLELLDFINLQGLVKSFGVSIMIGLDTETLMPLTVTQYFVLRPGDQGARVITALRNDGDAQLDFPFSHVLDSGGAVDFYNPEGPYGGFGYEPLSIANISGFKLVTLGFQAKGAGHYYVPELALAKAEGLPFAGAYVAVAGVAVNIIGATDLLGVLLASAEDLPDTEGLLHMKAGDVHVNVHSQLISGPAVNTAMDVAWERLGQQTAELSGVVASGDELVEGVRVTAVDGFGRALNQTLTDASGQYQMMVPPGTYTVRVWSEGHGSAEAELEAPGNTDLELGVGGKLRVSAVRVDGSPTPARVFVGCDGACPATRNSTDVDITYDPLPDDVFTIVYTGVDGVANIALPPGNYKVAVSRGPEWSIWPSDANITGGQSVQITGDITELTAEIAPVVDTEGVVSADFHVHGINSPDSPVTMEDRVRNFLGEGVDVLVATDHDFITDYGPTVAALGAEDEIETIVGIEVTTFDYGHFNGFPLVVDPSSRNGGAFDWAGGTGEGKTPGEIFEWLDGFAGEQVVMVNHGENYIESLDIDVLAAKSLADPTVSRMPAATPDAETGDTGLWSENFTAFEIYNKGYEIEAMRVRIRWWLTMLGRGFTPTATAVSDTHKMVLDPGGSPRTYTFIDGDYSEAALVSATNAGKVVGSNGPFFRVEASYDGEIAGMGETLAVPAGNTVRVSVHLDLPEWMTVDTIQVLSNLEDDVIQPIGAPNEGPLVPTMEVPVEWTADHIEVVSTGTTEHRHMVQTVEIDVPVTADAYIVILVRSMDEGAPGVFPIITNGYAPFAYSNPIYIDADGGGYNNPIFKGRTE